MTATPHWRNSLLEGAVHVVLRLAIDNHMVDADDADAEQLRWLHDVGWLALSLTDVTRTEWAAASADKRAELEVLAERYSEWLRPSVVGHSRPNSSVLGTSDDLQLLERMHELIRGRPWPQGRPQDVRDTMNIATSIRYALVGFVTRDEDLLAAAAQIQEAFNGFLILTPNGALAIAKRQIAKDEELERRRARDGRESPA
jgi:hypothetical protein